MIVNEIDWKMRERQENSNPVSTLLLLLRYGNWKARPKLTFQRFGGGRDQAQSRAGEVGLQPRATSTLLKPTLVEPLTVEMLAQAGRPRVTPGAGHKSPSSAQDFLRGGLDGAVELERLEHAGVSSPA